MPRETKAQREAREAEEYAAYLAEQKATYSQRLMEILERAQNVNFELTVVDGNFRVKDRDVRGDGFFELAVAYDEESDVNLDSLKFRVEAKEESEREAHRKLSLRQQALGKLTKEELEVLGIK